MFLIYIEGVTLVNPVIEFTSKGISILGFTLAWYGIIITAGVTLAIILSMREAKRTGLDGDIIIDLSLLIIPLAIIGARLYYVVFEWDMFKGNLWHVFDLRRGGLAIYGAVIFGAVGVILFSKWKKISALRFFDILAPVLMLAQGIGRWGNFINQEAYGYAITNPALQWFPFAVFINATGKWHYATFFYESLWCVLGFFALYAYRLHSKRDGNVFAAYWLIYGFERTIVEGLRTDSLWWGPFRVSQVLSVIMFIAAGVYLVMQWYARRQTSREVVPVDESLKIIPGYEGDSEDYLAAMRMQESGGHNTDNNNGDEQSDPAQDVNMPEANAQSFKEDKPDEA